MKQFILIIYFLFIIMGFLNYFFDRNHKSKAQKLNEEDVL